MSNDYQCVAQYEALKNEAIEAGIHLATSSTYDSFIISRDKCISSDFLYESTDLGEIRGFIAGYEEGKEVDSKPQIEASEPVFKSGYHVIRKDGIDYVGNSRPFKRWDHRNIWCATRMMARENLRPLKEGRIESITVNLHDESPEGKMFWSEVNDFLSNDYLFKSGYYMIYPDRIRYMGLEKVIIESPTSRFFNNSTDAAMNIDALIRGEITSIMVDLNSNRDHDVAVWNEINGRLDCEVIDMT